MPEQPFENQIKTKAEAAAKSQTKISGADIAQFNSLIQGVIQQEVVKMKVICENSEQAGGRYKNTYRSRSYQSKCIDEYCQQCQK